MAQDLALTGRELVEVGIRAAAASPAAARGGAAGGAPAKASRTNPASRGEKTASPSCTRRTASASSAPEIDFVT